MFSISLVFSFWKGAIICFICKLISYLLLAKIVNWLLLLSNFFCCFCCHINLCTTIRRYYLLLLKMISHVINKGNGVTFQLDLNFSIPVPM